MNRYTLGIILSQSLNEVVLIEKLRPDWQRGKLNFIGGKVENGESYIDCMVRESREETGIHTDRFSWRDVGKFINPENYEVRLFLCIYDPSIHGDISPMEDMEVGWYDCDALPKNCIGNIKMLVEYGRLVIRQGNPDSIIDAIFTYNGELK